MKIRCSKSAAQMVGPEKANARRFPCIEAVSWRYHTFGRRWRAGRVGSEGERMRGRDRRGRIFAK